MYKSAKDGQKRTKKTGRGETGLNRRIRSDGGGEKQQHRSSPRRDSDPKRVEIRLTSMPDMIFHDDKGREVRDGGLYPRYSYQLRLLDPKHEHTIAGTDRYLALSSWTTSTWSSAMSHPDLVPM